MSPYDTLNRRAAAQPDATAFIFEDESWSYRRLLEAADRLAAGLAARGVRPGDRVALHMRNRPELFMGYLACFRLGAIAAPINTRLKTGEVRSLLERLQARLYLGQDALAPVVADIEEEILPLGARFVSGDAAAGRARNWGELLLASGEEPPAAPDDEDAVVALLTTSGTTGEPKFVAHTNRSVSAALECLRALGLGDAGAVAVAAPAVHVSGLGYFLLALHVGTPAVVLERFDADALLDAIARRRIGGLIGAPFAYAELIERQRARPRDVSSLAVCYVGSDACPPERQLAFAEVFGLPLRSVWGSTETCMLRPVSGLGSVMKAAEWLALDVVDDLDAPVGVGDVGELLVRGPTVMAGYWRGPGRIEHPRRDGWFATGDLVRREGGDEVRFVGRKKDLIVRGGSNIAPLEIELILRGHPAVAAVSVTGVPDEALGQRVAAVIQLAPNAPPGVVPEILDRARRDLADYKVPELVRIVDALPVNALGKVDRRATRLLAEEAVTVGA